MRFSFQSRIVAGCLLVVVATLLLSAIIMEEALRRAIYADVEARLAREFGLVVEIIQNQQPGDGASSNWNAMALELSNKLFLRVSILSPSGVLLGESWPESSHLFEVKDMTGRPEVQQAFREGRATSLRFSTVLNMNVFYLAGLLERDNKPWLMVRLGLPMDEELSHFSAARQSMWWSFILAVPLALGMTYFMSRGLAKPVRDLTRIANSVAQGNLEIRMPYCPPHEVGDLSRAFNYMIDALQAKIKEEEQSKQRQDALLKGMSEGVMLTDAKGMILLVNRAFMEMVNFPYDPVGNNFCEIARSPVMAKAVQEILTGGPPLVKVDIEVPDSLNRFVEVNLVRLPQTRSDGGLVLVFHDVSGRKQIEQARRNLVADASHELRTPLTAIRAAAETLLNGTLTELKDKRHFVEIIERQTARLERLAEGLLSLARLDSLDSSLEKEEVPPYELVQMALENIESQARIKGVALDRDLAEDLPFVRVNLMFMEQAVSNLLDNAVKYTQPGGRITIAAHVAGRQLVLTVKDTGIGIPVEHLPRLFERFYRVDKNRSRQMGGTGLGLAIVKHVVSLHGGRIEVESQEGVGSLFRIVLPLL